MTSAQAGTSAAIFTQVAGQQNYKPQYLLSSDTVALPNATGADAPDIANLNGAVNVTAQAYGEETAPGFKPEVRNAEVQRALQRSGHNHLQVPGRLRGCRLQLPVVRAGHTQPCDLAEASAAARCTARGREPSSTPIPSDR